MRSPISRIVLFTAILSAWLGVSAPVLACSCLQPKGSEEEQVKQELADAKVVFVGKVTSLQRSFVDRYQVEEAEVKVVQVFKGDVKVGQTLKIRSSIGGGMCGRSVREGADASTPVAKLDEWLLYGYGDGAFEVSICNRSNPVTNTRDIELLKRLTATK
jgi:hypothetical protein